MIVIFEFIATESNSKCHFYFISYELESGKFTGRLVTKVIK